MKAVILAGGRGTRISEETTSKPKPLITIGEMPILWHIMKIYSHYGIHDFVICLGYKGDLIKQFFTQYELQMSDFTVDMVKGKIEFHKKAHEPWRVTLVNTGLDTATGGRLKRVREYVEGETFCFTYGDGLSNVNINSLLEFHRRQGKLATMTVCRHTSRFGLVKLAGDQVQQFVEKPVEEGSWMNSGFYVMESDFIDYIQGDETVLEKEPVVKLVEDGQLAAFKHAGFFRGMDSMRDRIELENLWSSDQAPWRVWKDDYENMRLSNYRGRGHWNLDRPRTEKESTGVKDRGA
jgi:glucose-1-phosphate cytidylyltransferase